MHPHCGRAKAHSEHREKSQAEKHHGVSYLDPKTATECTLSGIAYQLESKAADEISMVSSLA